jgi:hypothetical protein
MYVKTTNGTVDTYPYNVGKLRRDNPNTSFPKRISDEMLAEWGVYPVEYKPQPDYDDRTQRIEQSSQPVMEDGKWVIDWTVVGKTAEEVAQYDEGAVFKNRTRRNSMLAETDWWALSDVTMTEAQAAYRQALRDITDHVNFPHLVDEDWPVQPD